MGVAGDDREANCFDAAADERHGACVRAADIDDVFLVRNVVFFAQRDGFIHKAFVADGTGVGDFDGDAVVERVAALQIARAVVARGDVHRDADVRLNTLRRDLPAARADLLLHGEREVDVVLRLFHVHHRRQQHIAADAVVDGLCGDVARRKLRVRALIACNVADINVF